MQNRSPRASCAACAAAGRSWLVSGTWTTSKGRVAKDPAWRARFRAAFAEKDGRPNFSNFDFESPVFLFLYGEKDFPYIEMDSGIAAENMAIAAESLGLGTCMIGCIRDFLRSEAGAPWRKDLGIGEEDIFTVGLCIGHIERPTKKQERKEGRVRFL